MKTTAQQSLREIIESIGFYVGSSIMKGQGEATIEGYSFTLIGNTLYPRDMESYNAIN